MADFEDDAQIELLRRWWRENWKALVGGLLLGLGAIFGWEAWQNAERTKAEQASQMYEDLKNAVQMRPNRVAELAEQLKQRYDGTIYADQAALLLAQQSASGKDWQGAESELRWVGEHSKDPGLKKLAKLRLARVLWQQSQLDAALAELQIADEDAFAPLYLELRGDILVDKGERSAARAAYQKAMDLEPPQSAQELLRHKLEDVVEAKS